MPLAKKMKISRIGESQTYSLQFLLYIRKQIPLRTSSARKKFVNNVEWKNNHKEVVFQSRISIKIISQYRITNLRLKQQENRIIQL